MIETTRETPLHLLPIQPLSPPHRNTRIPRRDDRVAHQLLPHILVGALGVVPLVRDDDHTWAKRSLLQHRFEVDDVVPRQPPRLEAKDQLRPELHGQRAFDVALYPPRF